MSIDTLVEDILGLFSTEPHEADAANVSALGEQIAQTVAARLAEAPRPGTLRMSNLGKGDRQIWYEVKGGADKEEIGPETKIKFLFGDIWESIMLFLAKEAGHDVSHEQAEVEIDGVVGHMDAVIDGVVVDVKTASKFAFQKFAKGTLKEDDAFGYYEQLGAYSHALGGIDGAWLAVEKEQGKLTLLKADKSEFDELNIPARVTHLKEVLDDTEPPERCYEPVEHGKSGNMALGVNCSYCPFKATCWADANDGIGLRTFIYSKGPVHLTHVVKEPDVYEVTF